MTVKHIAPIVALDIGNVCLKLYRDRCAARLGYSSIISLLAAQRELRQYLLLIETGKISKEELLDVAVTRLGGRLTAADVEAAWCSIVGEEMPGIADVVREMVDMGLKPVFFSDVSEVHMACVRHNLSFLDLIHGEILSFRVGDIKPNPPMYEAMERIYCGGGIPALYIDDRPDNIAAGRERGWRTYQFGTVKGVRKNLNELRHELPIG